MSAPRRRATTRWTTGPPLVIGLVVLWLLLWRSVAPLTILTGLATALAVVRIFELPPVPHVGRVRPIALLSFAVWFAGQVVLGAVQVAWQAFRALGSRRGPRSGLVAAQLRTRDDLLLSLTAVVLALIPGTVIVEVDRGAAVLYLHVLQGDDPARLDAAKRSAVDTERRLVRAIGSPGEQEVLG